MDRQIEALTHVGNLGQTVTEFTITWGDRDSAELPASGWGLQNAFSDASRLVAVAGITVQGAEPHALRLQVEPFRYLASDWRVVCAADPSLSFGRADVTTVGTRTADAFSGCERAGVPYRLYTPDTPGPRPLMLFLHGGGEGGTDNWLQLVGTLGACAWAERYPGLMVLAPQNPVSWDAIRATVQSLGTSAPRLPGWSVETLDVVAGIIRELIGAGEVDPARVYVSGMSMGGAGTLRMVAHHRELFAAAAPICPSMNEETLPYLKSLVDLPLWVSSAYRDTFPTRHLQIVEGVEHLLAQGSRNARYTLYTAEELAAYGLGCHPDLSDDQRWGENHASWVLTLNNEYGIMDWLMSQHKA